MLAKNVSLYLCNFFGLNFENLKFQWISFSILYNSYIFMTGRKYLDLHPHFFSRHKYRLLKMKAKLGQSPFWLTWILEVSMDLCWPLYLSTIPPCGVIFRKQGIALDDLVITFKSSESRKKYLIKYSFSFHHYKF